MDEKQAQSAWRNNHGSGNAKIGENVSKNASRSTFGKWRHENNTIGLKMCWKTSLGGKMPKFTFVVPKNILEDIFEVGLAKARPKMFWKTLLGRKVPTFTMVAPKMLWKTFLGEGVPKLAKACPKMCWKTLLGDEIAHLAKIPHFGAKTGQEGWRGRG